MLRRCQPVQQLCLSYLTSNNIRGKFQSMSHCWDLPQNLPRGTIPWRLIPLLVILHNPIH